jgi:hypothetical protein
MSPLLSTQSKTCGGASGDNSAAPSPLEVVATLPAIDIAQIQCHYLQDHRTRSKYFAGCFTDNRNAFHLLGHSALCYNDKVL